MLERAPQLPKSKEVPLKVSVIAVIKRPARLGRTDDCLLF
jgi:hypothetical protein